MTSVGGETGPGAPSDVPGPVLAVFAHPDDETLLAGGLLALAAAEGRRVVVVTATRGERGEMIGRPDLEGTDAVALVREQEVAAALGALGVREHHWLGDLVGAGTGVATGPTGWTDSGMTWVAPGIAGPAPDAPVTALTSGDLEVQAAALARLIREVRPVVVVGDEAGGSYGHPDHSRAHAILARALVLAATNDDGVRPVHAALAVAQDRQRAANEAVAVRLSVEDAPSVTGAPLLPPPGGGTPLPTLTRPLADVDVELDTTGVALQVLAALRSYPSQVQAVTVPVLDGVRPGARGGAPTRALASLSTDQAAIGWYAMSNGVAQPLLPVVGLTAVRGDVADLRAALAGLPRVGGDGTGHTSGAAADPTAVRPLVTPPSRGRVAAVLACLVLGLVVGLTATVVHRWRVADLPLGLVLAVVTVVVGGLTARSWGRGAGLLGFAVGTVGIIQAMAFVVAGGDVLVPGDTLGMVWLLGSVAAVGVAAFLPERWVGRSRTR